VASAAPGLIELPAEARRRAAVRTITEPPLVRRLLVASGVGFLALVVLLPLGSVFAQAFDKGLATYLAKLADADSRASIELTLLTAAVVVPVNTVFGVAAAWLIAHYRFPGKRLLTTLIDVPFSVSPVISGLVFVLLFGAHGRLGAWLAAHDVQIIFALPGIVLATTFVTFPFVAREVLAVMEALGHAEEEAALTLGAGAWMIFARVTLPKIKWGLLTGVILCNARAMGEFGAVSVVSGHVRGVTDTMPLQVEVLYNDYDFVGAFAVASLLTSLAVVTLAVKKLVERQRRAEP
jgi:sulfate transport system permease protein